MISVFFIIFLFFFFLREDEEFISQFENNTLTSWSQENFIRVIWSYLKILGRREGLKKIFIELERHQGSG